MSRPVLPTTSPRDWDAFVKDWIPALREFAGRFVMDTFTWDPPNVAATSVVSTTLTSASYPEVVGLRPGMAIALTPPSDIDDDLTIECWCATADTLTIKLRNDTGGGIDQAEGVWSFVGVRP